MSVALCLSEGYDDVKDAKSVSRRLRIARRIETTVKPCDGCEKTHVVSTAPLSEQERTILFKVAQGLTNRDIADDMGVLESWVANRLHFLQIRFDALNRANLTAIAIWLGVVDVTPIMTDDTRRT